MGDRQNGCWGSFIDGAAYRGDAFSIAVDVRETSVSDLEFRQTGYVVSIVSPISTPAVLRSSAGSRSISIPAGTSRFCVSEPRYEVELAGCFRTPAGIETVSREHAELSLVPAVFAVEGRIEGEELAGMSEDVLVGNFKNGGNDAQILVRAKRETAVLAETVAKKTGDSYHYQLVVPRFHVSTSSFPRGRFRWNSVRPILRSCSSPRFSPSTCPRRTAFPRWSVSSRSRAASSPARSFPRFPT